ncbi:MAG: segregation/condensation protein A [Spirochaetes bacterium]|nr:segregation/condensation protein A [Spirochaetota bacterium]
MNEEPRENGVSQDESCILHIDNFDGPLSLLWELIKKSKIDITEVSLSVITEQYLGYMKLMEKLNVRIASEFISMASDLLFYKSRALLPAGKLEDEYFVPPLPPELIQKLLEYKKYQKSSEEMLEQFNRQSNHFMRTNREEIGTEPDDYINVTLFDLLKAFAEVMESRIEVEQQEIIFDEILVSDRIAFIAELMKDKEFILFSDLFGFRVTRPEIVASFLAILEMAKSKILRIMQHKVFGTIRIGRLDNGIPAPQTE